MGHSREDRISYAAGRALGDDRVRRWNIRLLLVAVGLAVVVCSIGGWLLLLGSSEPNEDVIVDALGEELPVYWAVTSATISVSSKGETEGGATSFKQRFEATVVPRESLYVPAAGVESIGPFTVIVMKTSSVKNYTLHGIAISTSSNERWVTKFTLDNSVDGLGMPQSAFTGPVVVSGSDAAARVKSELNEARALADTVVASTSRATAREATGDLKSLIWNGAAQ